MEIDKKKFNKNTKAIFIYCLCVLFFLIFNNQKVFVPITIPVVDIILYFSDLNKNIGEPKADLFSFFILIFIIRHTYIYITAIFFGIFKKIKNLKFKTSVLIIIIVNFIFYYFSSVRLYHNEWYAHINPKDAFSDYYFWILPVYFLIYKFWGYITKNSVINFEKIEYYMSIDFITDVLFKIKEKLKNHINR